MSDEKVVIHIERMNPETDTESHWETFEVPYKQRHSVLTLLHYVYENYDPTLAYRNYTCGRGLCNSCQVTIDGKVGKGCAIPVPAGAEIRVGPANGEVIRDVATVLRGGPDDPEILGEWKAESPNAARPNLDAL